MAFVDRANLEGEQLLFVAVSVVASTSFKIAAVAWLSRWATMVASNDLSIVLLLLLPLVAVPSLAAALLILLLLLVDVGCCPVALAKAFFAFL